MHYDECACEAKESTASKPQPKVRISLTWDGEGRNIDDTMYFRDITYKEFADLRAKVQAFWLRGVE